MAVYLDEDEMKAVLPLIEKSEDPVLVSLTKDIVNELAIITAPNYGKPYNTTDNPAPGCVRYITGDGKAQPDVICSCWHCNDYGDFS